MAFPEQRTRSNTFIAPIMFGVIIFLTLKFSNDLFFTLQQYQILLITIILIIISFISSRVEFTNSNKLTGFIQECIMCLLWAILMYIILAVIVYILSIPQNIAIYLLLIIVALFIYGYANAHHLVVKEETLKFENIKEEFNIAHLSDVHIGAIRRKSLATKVANKLEEINPDIAIISGDLADGFASLEENTFEDFKKLKFPVVFTPGNHDQYQGVESVKRIAKKGGMIILDNDMMKFKDWNIYGLSFDESLETFASVPNWRKMFDINPNENNLMVYHFPFYWEEFQKDGFDIQLSGHTHGMQFYPVIFIAKIIFKYNKGLFENNGKFLYVSEGVGSTAPPIRIGTNSSITILKIRKK